MTNILFAAGRTPVPANQTEVRSTVTVVDHDAPSAVAEHMPDVNEVLTDPDTEGGLTRHDVGAYQRDSEQYVPFHAADANAEHDQIVNRRISSSGTAAAREMAGEWGHGTMRFSQSIEPAWKDGTQFGSEYFAAEKAPIQEPAGRFMTASTDPDSGRAGSIATGNANARDASASLYADFYRATTGQG